MLTAKETKKLHQYEENFVMPKWKYVLTYGLAFSLVVIVVTLLYNWIFYNKPFADINWHLFITIPVSSFLYGVLMHWLAAKEYRQLKKKEPLPDKKL